MLVCLVLANAVRYNALICCFDINGKACSTNFSVINVMDILWNIGKGGAKRKTDDDVSTEGGIDSYIPPRLNYLQRHVKILSPSEGKHTSVQDLYLQGDHVNGLLTGVADFVGRMNIRKVAVLPAFFSEMLANNPDVDPLRYLQVYHNNYDILLAPVCESLHWYIVVFFVNEKKVSPYDSLKSGTPRIFNVLKTCIESVLHIQFDYEDKSDTVILQENGYDCGVNDFRMAEQICFTGENRIIEPFYAEAERARCREILRKLTDNEINDEWVPTVQSGTDFINLNKPNDEEVIIVNESDDDVMEAEVVKNVKSNDTVVSIVAGNAINVTVQAQNVNANLINIKYEPIDYNFLLNELKIVLPTEEFENDEELDLSGDQVMAVMFAAAEFVVKNNIRKVAVL
uniref:Ubiquitin-like protease family profile domain-containing protein n=1 Tax=Panagrolaimus sp. ES5 TaxID=591445 RepID=A0AC34FPX1_9BILA